MANTTVYPYGTGGSLPSSIGVINDLTTGGAANALSAEQGKVLNQKVEKNTEDIFSIEARPIDISSLTENSGWYINSSGKWVKNSDTPNNYKFVLIPITPGLRYRVYGDATIALLASGSRSSGSSADFCSGYSGRISIDTGNVYDVIVPEDAVYMYFVTVYSGTAKQGYAYYSDASYESVIPNMQEELLRIDSQKIDIDGIPKLTGWTINSSGNWVSQSQASQFSSVLIPITPGDDYIVITKTTNATVAVLASDTKTNNQPADFCEDFPSRIVIEPGLSYQFTAPEDAEYLYFLLKTSGNDKDGYVAIPKPISEQLEEIGGEAAGASEIQLTSIGNVADALGNKLYPLNPNLDASGFEIPETLQELNVQRKAWQFSKVKWTPLVEGMPYNSNPTTTNMSFPAGTEVTGLPYSSVKELDKYVMKDVSLYTYMTAVNNPYSLLYTENVSGDNSRSSWGKTYHGINCATYYGTVCSELSQVCVGYPIDYATEIVPWLASDYHTAVKIYDQSAQGVHVGDILRTDDHCRLVYAVKKNSSGVVTHVQIAESKHNHCIIHNPDTASSFNSELASIGCVIYRPLWLYKNIDYAPSPFVAFGDEVITPYVYNDDICTFAGDKPCFREGDTIAINYNLKQVGAWTGMELYKGSTLLDTITIDSSEHVVDLSSLNLTYGKYKARMTDGTNYSDYTEWEILQADVTFVNNGDITTVTPTSANGIPVEIKVCGQNGSAYMMLELNEEQQNAASFDINLIELNIGQRPSKPMRGVSGLYLKIFFQGEFGRVTNEPLPIYFT